MTDFSILGLSNTLVKALAAQEIVRPFSIQEQAIPAILSKRDILGIAKTGSGKTASYVLPILMQQQGKQPKNRHVQVLVMVPTRELAVQVQGVFQQFGRFEPKPIKSLAVYGGVSINPQMMALQGVHVLVATPGRLIELLACNAVQINEIETLVLDEADKMLNMGFKAELDQILGLLPKRKQSLFFSATLSDDVQNIQAGLLHNPLVVKVQEPVENLNLITHSAYWVREEKKGPLLRQILANPTYTQVLIFCSTVYQVDNVTDKLLKNGYDAMSIHSKKSMGARTDALRNFKDGKLRILVTTDLLARGIDVPYLPCVINYELPRSPKDYIHRVGRTGRAESPGVAISLITAANEQHFKVIQKKIKRSIELQDADVISKI
ncbi:MAG: DEAD/DEAH box helicase [bacterium]|nr:DEAD/DEAH box helicase [bacterium]